MKYKVGDKVRIKSIDWYNENKDKYGNINCGDYLMTFEKSQFCGKIVTISSISDVTDSYKIEENNGRDNWTDGMIEGLVEETHIKLTGKAINALKKQISDARKNIESTLIKMMNDNNVENIDCTEYSHTPTIENNMDIFTLIEIQLCRTKGGDEYILCVGSGEYDTIYITAKSMDIEYLIEVYEWTLENQVELFERVE